MSIRSEGLTVTYGDVEYLIHSIIYKFKRVYGGDFDELLSEANLIFLRVYDWYDRKRGTFQAYLAGQLWFGFIDMARREGRILRRVRPQDLEPDLWGYVMEEHPIRVIKRNLTRDARTVVNLVLESPPEISWIVSRRGGRPLHYKAAIRDYLERKGWPPLRIAETFEEIRRVL